LDSNFSWQPHIEAILAKATQRLYFLKQLTRAGVPHSQLRHFYLTVIRPVLEYSSPVWHHLITKKQSDQIEAIQKRAIRIIYPCAHDMPYTSAIFLADLPTMSDRRDQLARKLFKSTIHPIHPPYITFFPLLENIHLSLDYESPKLLLKFPRIPPEPKNTNYSSHMLSPTIRLHNCFFFSVFIVLCVFVCVCLLSTILFSL